MRIQSIERLVVIFDRMTKTLCNNVVSLMKVQWKHHKGSKRTWELEEEMCGHYHELFATTNFEELVKESCNTLLPIRGMYLILILIF